MRRPIHPPEYDQTTPTSPVKLEIADAHCRDCDEGIESVLAKDAGLWAAYGHIDHDVRFVTWFELVAEDGSKMIQGPKVP